MIRGVADAAVLVRELARAAAAGAAEIRAGERVRASLRWENKGASDFVTEVDRAAERAIRDALAPLRIGGDPVPLLAEESWPGDEIPGGWCIVADPLDGTTNFLHRFPPYAVSIAALLDGEPVAGVVLDVTRGETYSAWRGGGAFRDTERLAVSSQSMPERALIGTGFPFGGNAPLELYARQFVPIARATAGIRRAGSAAIDLAMVAAGALDAFWELYLAPWDVAAGLLLVAEAGGVATTPDGAPARVARGPLVAGNPAMHRWLVRTLRDATHTGESA